MPSINDDEELARALQEEYEREASRSRQRRQQQRPPPTAPHEERPRRQSRPAASNVAPSTTTVESDEHLARRLEQEMKDEELARRLSASTENLNAPSRPRPSASTLMQSNSRRGIYSAGTPVIDSVTSSPRSSRRSSSLPRSVRPSSSDNAHNSHRDRRSTSSGRRASSSRRDRHGTSSSNRRSSDGTGGARRSSTSNRRSSEASSRDRRGTRQSSSPRRRSSDWTRSTAGGANPSSSTRQSSRRSSSRNAHNSGQSHSLSRGRGSAVSPAVEPDYALPVTSVDPPIVAATVVEAPPPTTTMTTSVSPTMMDPYDTEPDVELAMRLAQEERDAALAQQLERSEQEVASRNASRLATAISSGPRRRWTCRRIAGTVVPLVLIAGAAVVVMLLVAGRGDLSGVPNIFDDDPFAGNPDDASRWKNKGNGLRLEVVNALQEQWHNNFNIAVAEWDAGTPDALTLTTSTAEYDYDCKPIQGKIKVCNGDYGDTRWKGVNQVLLSGGWIISSTAKLNEYYLARASEAQRQYTTCHEIGHGFGLPHTDEDFYNRDLGNCMDYTNNPSVNKSPDEMNYEFLLDLYGPVPQRRDLKGFLQADGEFDEEFLDLYMSTVHKMEFEDTQHGVIWKLLHTNTHGEFFSADLGNNYTVQVHVLLAD